MTDFERRRLLLGGAALLAAGSLPAHGQPAQYPGGPVTLVVPFAAGGSNDTTARLLALGLGQRLQQPFVVDNRSGAGGNIGAAAVARARADGQTLLFASSAHATNMSLYRKPGYDLLKDLVPVSLVSTIPNVLVVPAASPVASVADFIKQAKASAHPLSYGSAGSGSSQHLAAAQFARQAGVELLHIPFKGGSLANQELLAGRLDATFGPMVEILPFIESGKLKPLGVTSIQRSARLPDVPAINETLPGYKSELWNSLMAPSGTPPAVVEQLAAAIRAVLQDPEVRRQLTAQGTVVVASTPAEFARLLPTEIAERAKVVQSASINLD